MEPTVPVKPTTSPLISGLLSVPKRTCGKFRRNRRRHCPTRNDNSDFAPGAFNAVKSTEAKITCGPSGALVRCPCHRTSCYTAPPIWFKAESRTLGGPYGIVQRSTDRKGLYTSNPLNSMAPPVSTRSKLTSDSRKSASTQIYNVPLNSGASDRSNRPGAASALWFET